MGDGPMRDKREVLQVLLDTGNVAGDLFDAIEADSFEITPELLARLANLHRRLEVTHRSLFMEYVLSGRAGNDMLAGIQDQLRAGRTGRESDPHG